MTKEDQVIKDYGSSVSRYHRLELKRTSLEPIWEDCSALTLPYVYPDEHRDVTQEYSTPYNSIGPASVNNLASKLLMALLPASGNFFRLIPHSEVVDKLSPQEVAALDKELSKVERGITTLIDTQALRVPLYEALKLLIITGNVMLYKVKGSGMKVFNPYEYVVSRDYVGNIVEICIREKIAKSTLPEEVQDVISEHEEYKKDTDELYIYTSIVRTGENKFMAYQEVCDTVIPGTVVTYKEDEMPYMVLRWTNTFNEAYGRGLVEQYLGDLRSLEGLSKIMLDGSGIASKFVFGLKPAASTKLEDLTAARNGDIILGDLERDITILQTNKAPDLNVPYQLLGQLEARLNRAFLNVQGGIRDSERTTAVEVRATIAELEAALGGTYSVLAQEFQLPLLTLLLKEINPKVLDITIPSIVTGASAISRERDLQNLTYMVQSMAQLGPEVLMGSLKVDGYLRAVATALGIDPDAVVKSPEEKQAEQQQAMAQQQAMMQQQQNMALQQQNNQAANQQKVEASKRG
jgi:hypothetical protein